MTDQQQGGTTPEPEALASVPRTSEDTVAAVAVADEPATIADSPTDTAPETEPQPEPVVTAPEEPAATAPEEPAATAAGEPAATAPEASAAASETETRADAPAAIASDNGTLSADDTADAPAADDEPAPVPARDLGPEPTTMEELLAEQDSDIKSFKHGDVVEGQVVRIDKDEILVDIGAKSEGVVSNRELFGRNTESQPALNIGDTVLVYVLQPESPEGHVVLSLRRAGLERKWRSMQEQF